MGTRAGVALDQQNYGPTWRRTSFAAHAHLSGNIVSEGCVERFAVVCEELPVVACTRHRNVGHTTVERTLSTQFGVHVNQNTVGGLSLAGMGGHSLAMIEMWIFTRVEFDRSFCP
jgi:hypothetical protein